MLCICVFRLYIYIHVYSIYIYNVYAYIDYIYTHIVYIYTCDIYIYTPIENKKKLYAKKKYICISCKKEGGTIFNESSTMLKATCGNIKEPCDLNIEIVKMKQQMLDDEFIDINNKIPANKNS